MRIMMLIYMVAMATAFVFADTANAAGPRFGEVVLLEAIENRGDDESTVTKSKRKIGRALGGLAGMGNPRVPQRWHDWRDGG